MTDTKEVTANELHGMMKANADFTDIGNGDHLYANAVQELRDAGHVILVGPRLKMSDGKTSRMVGFGQAESIKSKVVL